MSKAELTYASSGVSFDANEIAMNSIKSTIESTYRPEVLSHVGSFGGLFQLDNYVRTGCSTGVKPHVILL